MTCIQSPEVQGVEKARKHDRRPCTVSHANVAEQEQVDRPLLLPAAEM